MRRNIFYFYFNSKQKLHTAANEEASKSTTLFSFFSLNDLSSRMYRERYKKIVDYFTFSIWRDQINFYTNMRSPVFCIK